MFQVDTPLDRRLLVFPFLILLIPVFLFFGFGKEELPQREKVVNHGTNVERIVVVIVDALRKSNVDEDMPRLKSFAQNSLYLRLDTCLANFTLPCVQTLFEGKETPPEASLHNFTGAKSHRSILSTLAEKNWKIETYSDHTAGALFSDVSTITENGDKYPGTLLDKDLQLIDKAKRSLERNESKQLIILHVPGTDKKVHTTKVGGNEYRQHFGAVDEALGSLIETLDFEHDFLFIAGDHGHNDKGFHEPISVALLQGPDYLELDKLKAKKLAAVDLSFFLSFLTKTPLPKDYEGNHFWLTDEELNDQKTTFQDLEYRRLKGTSLAGKNLDQLLESQAAERRESELVWLVNLLSSFVLFLALLLSILFPNPDWKRADLLIIFIAIVASFVFFRESDFQNTTFIFRGLLFAIAFFFILFKNFKIGLLSLSLFFLSLGTAFYDREIHAYFREGDGGDFTLIVYGGATLLSILAGLFFVPGVLQSEEKEAAMNPAQKNKLALTRKNFRLFVIGFSAFFGMFALGSGGYFYSSSTNFFNMLFFVGGVVLLSYYAIQVLEEKRLPELPRAKYFIHILVFLGVALLLQHTDELNWRWMFLLTPTLKTNPLFSYILILFSLGYFWWSVEDKRRYLTTIVPLGLLIVAYTSWAGLELAAFAVSLLPSLLMVSYLSLRKVPEGECTFERAFESTLLYCVLIATTWISLDGFDISNIDYSTFDQRFPNYVAALSTDAQRILFYGPLTFPKYMLTLLLPLSIFALIRGIKKNDLLYLIVIGLFQLLFLGADLSTSIAAGSVLVAPIIDDILFVWSVSFSLTIVLLFYALAGLRKNPCKLVAEIVVRIGL